MPKKSQHIDRAACDIMKALGFHAGPEHLGRDLKSALGLYLMDGGRWRALDAVALVVIAILDQHGKTGEEFDGVHPNKKVEIPWWVARSIFIASMEWRDGQVGHGPNIRLGQAFELEHRERGKPSPYKVAQLEERDMRLALLVAERRPLKLEAAVYDVANEAGLKERIRT